MATKPKPHNGGQWTEARFKAFIISALRQASNRWPPKYMCRKAAWISRGLYWCAGYKQDPHKIAAKEVKVDHIIPVVDPATGFTTFDDFIKRLFTEQENFQVLCEACHQRKTNDEKGQRKNVK